MEGHAKIKRILLSNERVSATELVDQIYPQSQIGSCLQIDEIAGKILQFLNGEDIQFSLDIVDFNLIKPFQKSVLIAEHGIPRGWISSYQRLANHIGNPKAVRAVGTALKNNPFPIIIPCHRAIRSNGTLGGFQGGMMMKRALLEMEGIRFSSDGKVLAKNFL
jgi:methylated-DNA-[protein]-cysteine S-methyltransferase